MTLREETVNLDDEVERLKDATREKAEQVADLDEDVPEEIVAELRRQGDELDAQLAGVRWARDRAHESEVVPRWDEPVDELTFAGLSAGEVGRIEDDVEDGGAGMVRVMWVAHGTVDAPYVDPDMTVEERIGAVAQLPIGFVKWAEARVDDLSTVEGNGGKRFDDWLADAKQETSTES